MVPAPVAPFAGMNADIGSSNSTLRSVGFAGNAATPLPTTADVGPGIGGIAPARALLPPSSGGNVVMMKAQPDELTTSGGDLPGSAATAAAGAARHHKQKSKRSKAAQKLKALFGRGNKKGCEEEGSGDVSYSAGGGRPGAPGTSVKHGLA
jgi:hypothetical protein